MILPTARQIADEVATRYGLTFADFKGRSRIRAIAWPRQEAMAAIYDTGRFSEPWIGRLFGRDHSTVHHAREAVLKRTPEQRAYAPATFKERRSTALQAARAAMINAERRYLEAASRSLAQQERAA